MKETKNEIVIKSYDLAKPEEVVSMAKTLKNYIVKEKLYAEIKGRNYAMVEGWQFAGFLTGLNVITEEPINLSTDKIVKWGCIAKIYSKDILVGNGYAVCSNQEANKKTFEEYAIVSMCQTRAIGKAYRNKIGWIMKLANMEATPAEEMDATRKTKEEPENVKDFMEDMQPAEEEVIQWGEKIESARDKKELKSFWETTPPIIRAKIQGTYENVKAKLK